MNPHISMQTHAENYLSERRRLGYGLRTPGYSVISFARYIDTLNSQEPLIVEIMADWARQDQGNTGNPSTWARRLKNLRSFCRYLQQFEPRTEVPDDTIFGRIGQRLVPHIYSEQEIIDLLAAAHNLGSLIPGLRGATYETLFGLIASTGLRISEALHLLDTDVNLKLGMLTIRQTKFAKSRHVLLHPSTIDALQRYRALRNPHIDVADESPFFVGARGRRLGQPLSMEQVHRVFISLRNQLGWTNRGAHNGPRIHDLRHTFVVRRVLLWQAQGLDVDQHMLTLSTYVGHTNVTNTYWYLTGIPQRPVSFASLVQQFFTEYLVAQRALSPRTIASYRDAMLLFLDFAQHRLGKMPTALNLNDITPDLILAFLDHLEQERQNSVRSRNLRLTALRAFLKFAARRDVTSFFIIEQALGVPMKRFERPMLGFLSREEMLAVIGQPGDTWTSQRDHLLLAMLYNTGARVSEIIGVKVGDVVLGESACVHLRGKGRKQRSTPLWKSTVQEIGVWLQRNPMLGADAALLPNRDGFAMTRCNVTQRLNIAVACAAQTHISLTKRSISPHTIRHTTAMHLLQSGVAFRVSVLAQTLPALTKGRLPFRLAIPETFSSVIRWAFMSTLPEARVAGSPAGRFRCKSCDHDHTLGNHAVICR